MKENQDIIKACGSEIKNKDSLFYKIVCKYYKDVCDTINGVITEKVKKKVIGGPAIRKVIDVVYNAEIQSIEPDVDEDNIVEFLHSIGGNKSIVSLFF
jgi:hypothetical protein